MRASLRLESIGHTTPGWDVFRRRPWVADLTEPGRRFLKPQVDWRDANGTGSRGVYYYYWLEPGVYEVSQPISWKRTDRYYLLVDPFGKKSVLTAEEVHQWRWSQSARSVSRSIRQPNND